MDMALTFILHNGRPCIVSNVDIAVCGKSADGVNIDLGFLGAMHLYTVWSKSLRPILKYFSFAFTSFLIANYGMSITGQVKSLSEKS